MDRLPTIVVELVAAATANTARPTKRKHWLMVLGNVLEMVRMCIFWYLLIRM